MENVELNSLAKVLVGFFKKKDLPFSQDGMQVNPIVSGIATWYEKFRNAIDYQEEEVLLRATIERILKRRLLLGGDGKSLAKPLVRELVWARYFPDRSITEDTVQKVQETVNTYLEFRKQLIARNITRESVASEWMYELLSCQIEDLVSPNKEKDAMVNFIFHIVKDNITIEDDPEEDRDAQVFIAIRQAYAKNDRALLRYHLFKQFFGDLEEETLEKIVTEFEEGRRKIEEQLAYPLRHKIHSYIKKQIPPFLILEDILRSHRDNLDAFLTNTEELQNAVFATCDARYKGILAKVRRATIRSVIFILISKAFFAFTIEGTYENIVYGRILWGTIVINIAAPVTLMGLSSIFIRIPGRKNTERIHQRILNILFNPEPRLGRTLTLHKEQKKSNSVLDIIFKTSWTATFILSFGAIIVVLSKIGFNPVSQAFFLFFLAIVSFLVYRINQTAHIYAVEERQNLLTPIIDFFFLPIAQVGRHLTEGISQINVFLFLFDLIIEAPFKGLFAFFDQWLLFLHAKREDLD